MSKLNNNLIIIKNIFLIIIIEILVFYIFQFIFKKIKNKNEIYIRFFHNIFTILFIIFSIFLILNQIPAFEHFMMTILAGSGIIAIILSLSAQESVKDIISGLSISIFKPFNIGDRITIINKDITGIIEDISLRHTIILTFKNSRIIIPNSVMNKEIIENSDYKDEKALAFVDVNISYNSDIKKAIKIISDIISSHQDFMDIRTQEEKDKGIDIVPVYLRNFDESGIALRALVWTKTVNKSFQVCSDIRLLIKEKFDQEGIKIPYKQLDVNLSKKTI